MYVGKNETFNMNDSGLRTVYTRVSRLNKHLNYKRSHNPRKRKPATASRKPGNYRRTTLMYIHYNATHKKKHNAFSFNFLCKPYNTPFYLRPTPSPEKLT